MNMIIFDIVVGLGIGIVLVTILWKLGAYECPNCKSKHCDHV